MNAGKLRHRVTFQSPGTTQDPVTGEMVQGWATVWDKVPASVEPLSVKDYIASHAVQAEIAARITIRFRAGVSASMRIIHRGEIYNILGVLSDPNSGLEWLTLPCSKGVNEG